MKVMSELFETVINKVQDERQGSVTYVLMLVILVVAAGSLYVLVNAPA
jgi:uncharacterized Rmd1/YagE family protein